MLDQKKSLPKFREGFLHCYSNELPYFYALYSIFMYLYKLPQPNQYIFIKDKSLYNLYKPKKISDHLLVPEKIYKKYEKYFGEIGSTEFKNSAFESIKEQFLEIFSSNQLNGLQKLLLAFLIQQFKISKDQYSEALQKILSESHSFDLQMQLARYDLIKNQYPSTLLGKWWRKIR